MAVFRRRQFSAEKGICHMQRDTITQLPDPSGFSWRQPHKCSKHERAMLTLPWLDNRAVEDPHLGPIVFVLFDKLQMTLGDLVGIVCWTILEHAMQRDVKIGVDFAVELAVTPADGKINQSIMVIEVLVASGQQCLNRFFAAIVESEKNMMCKLWHSIGLGFR